MIMKQQYKEAQRVARLTAKMFSTLKAEIDYMTQFRWNFSMDMYLDARKSLKRHD